MIAISGDYMALKSDGTIAAWGNGKYGLSTVPAGLNAVSAIAAGDTFGLALKTNGTIVGLGNQNSPVLQNIPVLP